jgi:hypothetical protein
MTVVEARGASIWDETEADYIVVPVNTQYVMGAGMALEARERCPGLFAAYTEWCKTNIKGGSILFTDYQIGSGPKVVLLATKESWREGSRLDWVEKGLCNLRQYMMRPSMAAIPLLGCGKGGLHPERVVSSIYKEFAGDPARMAVVYHDNPKEDPL